MNPCFTSSDIIERDAVWSGEIDGTTYEVDLDKLKGDHRHFHPGSRVLIRWKSGLVDSGFIFTMPGPDWDDVFMRGIIQIPKPAGCEKGDCEPVWIHLSDLLSIEILLAIELQDTPTKIPI